LSGQAAIRRPHATAWANASLALAGCLWGTGFLFGKIAFREMTVAENVFFRFLFACVILVPILIARGKAFTTRDLWWLVAAAVIGVPVQFLMQFKGLQLTTVSHASLIVGTLPVLIALSSTVFLRERLSKSEWIVLLLSPVGVLAIAFSAGRSTQEGGPTVLGDLLILLSMCAAAASILITKHLMTHYDSLQITVWMLNIGAVLLFVGIECFFPVRFHFSLAVWGAAAAQGLLATASAYLAWNWGLKRVPASRAGVFLNLEPLIGSLLGVTLLHERLRAAAILGGVLILGPATYFSRKTE
jgi:drug/metabolite transporter (DMT)-like permease